MWHQVIGKALVLDEIINYIQSLQRQVEVHAELSFGHALQLLVLQYDIENSFCLEILLIHHFTFQFLSMKLEAVNSRMDPGIEGFPSKDVSSTHIVFNTNNFFT